MMEYIRVTKDNLESEHICCAISNNRDIQVASKKAWLAQRFDDGLVFLKSVERGKCFIEYIPAENAWNPIVADGYILFPYPSSFITRRWTVPMREDFWKTCKGKSADYNKMEEGNMKYPLSKK